MDGLNFLAYVTLLFTALYQFITRGMVVRDLELVRTDRKNLQDEVVRLRKSLSDSLSLSLELQRQQNKLFSAATGHTMPDSFEKALNFANKQRTRLFEFESLLEKTKERIDYFERNWNSAEGGT